MSRFRHITLRSLISVDEQTAEWMALARTPGTRVRIRRWARMETISLVATLASVAALIVIPFVTLALALWFGLAHIHRSGIDWWLWGTTISVAVIGAILGVVSSEQRRKACFADGYVSVGRVDEVIEHPGSCVKMAHMSSSKTTPSTPSITPSNSSPMRAWTPS